MADQTFNPMGTRGFEFVEFTGPDVTALTRVFQSLGFAAVAMHRSKNVTLFRQGGINFILNGEGKGFPKDFRDQHGPSVCAIALRVDDAPKAMSRAQELGAKALVNEPGPMELSLPGIEAIGGSRIFFIDRYDQAGSIYDIDFKPIKNADQHPAGAGLLEIDHLTNNVYRGRMNHWAEFYERLFNFREIRYFDIEGKLTGLKSRAMTSPDGNIRIPINESSDDKSQIEEYLREYKGEGIQHIALSTDDIYNTVDVLRGRGVAFQDTPETYYEGANTRVAGHQEDIEELRKRRILIDGNGTNHEGVLLQIFTSNVIGPIFFEIIQRKGNQGFGEGNFKALFESIELDQIRRGVV
jgi:4-hydroxyphenylpyruvate dioxygenase